MVNCSGRGVKDLTGLEACTNLETIDCSNNDISTVSLPRLTKLTTLRCYGNPVEKLDLTGCSALQALYLQDVSTNAVSGTSITVSGYNQAASLTLSVADTPFTTLLINSSPTLTSIDITANTQLEGFYCNSDSSLKNIDVSTLTALKYLDVSDCDLQTLDVTHNVDMEFLYCNGNSLSALDVTKNTNLLHLICHNNNLSDLNVTSNISLQRLEVQANNLSAINLRNNKDMTYLDISGNSAVNILNVSNNQALTELRASGLSIYDINLSANTALTVLDLSDNAGLTVLDLSGNVGITTLDISNLSMDGINISMLQDLQELGADLNFILNGNITFGVIPLYVSKAEVILFNYDGTNCFITCATTNTTMSWEDANKYWQAQGLRLPTKDEAFDFCRYYVSILTPIFTKISYNNYIANGTYWTSTYSSNSGRYVYIDMSDGSTYTGSSPRASFGVYTK